MRCALSKWCDLLPPSHRDVEHLPFLWLIASPSPPATLSPHAFACDGRRNNRSRGHCLGFRGAVLGFQSVLVRRSDERLGGGLQVAKERGIPVQELMGMDRKTEPSAAIAGAMAEVV